MCTTCGCNYPNYNHGNQGLQVPMKPNGINPMPLANGIPQSKKEEATPRKPKK